ARTDPPLDLTARACPNDRDVSAAAAVIVAGDDDVIVVPESDSLSRTRTVIKYPEDASSAAGILYDKVIAAIAVIVARSRVIVRSAPLGVRHRSVRGRAIEPVAWAARSVNRQVIHSIVVIIANNRRIVTGLAKGFYPSRVGRTVKNVESSLSRYARTPHSYIVLIIAIVVGGNKEVTGESPIKSDRRTTSVEVVVPASL